MAECRLGRPLNVLVWLVPSTSRVDSQSLVPSHGHLFSWPAAWGQPAPTLALGHMASVLSEGSLRRRARGGVGRELGNSGKFSSALPSTLSLCSSREQGKSRLIKYRQGAWGSPGSHAAPRGLAARQRGPKVGDPLGAVYPELPWQSTELFEPSAIWLASGCFQMRIPAPNGAGEGWFPSDTLPAGIYPRAGRAPASHRLNPVTAPTGCCGERHSGWGERPKGWICILQRVILRSGYHSFKKHNCTAPGCNLWKADVPQTLPPFNSNRQNPSPWEFHLRTGWQKAAGRSHYRIHGQR